VALTFLLLAFLLALPVLGVPALHFHAARSHLSVQLARAGLRHGVPIGAVEPALGLGRATAAFLGQRVEVGLPFCPGDLALGLGGLALAFGLQFLHPGGAGLTPLAAGHGTGSPHTQSRSGGCRAIISSRNVICSSLLHAGCVA
jgi:hypothetical protein